MASIVSYDGGLKRIEFSLTPNGTRKVLRLGGVNSKTAGTWKAMVETIIGDKLANRPHDAETSKWLGGLDESMLKRLRAVGLADGVGLTQSSIELLLNQFFATLPGKASTRTCYSNVRRNLEDFFGKSKLVRDLTTSNADAWRAWLVEHEQLALATVSRRVIAARTIWAKAVRWKMASENVFSGVRAGQQANESRKHFVSRNVAEAVLAACPNTQWKLIFALARFGGLRCPSEHLALQWQDVDFDKGRISVRSSKTEHHEGGASRTLPLFPELLQPLLDAFSEAPEGSKYVITQRDPKVNWRTHLKRIIRKSGIVAWPKLMHNLRASRESELMREYDLATVCKWIGNSPTVAAKHYAISVDLNADFAKAIGQAQQKAQQTADSGACQDVTSIPPNNEKTPEIPGNVTSGQPLAKAVNKERWAIQDSNL